MTIAIEPHAHHAPHVHITAHATGKRHVLHDVLDLLLLGLVVLLAWNVWPAALGGKTRFIMVTGASMEPRFHIGDSLVVRANDDPQIGDIIVFRIPKGDPAEGSYVVHRIFAQRDDGSYMTKGDNRRYADPWHVTTKDILGTPTWTIPQFGRLLQMTHSPFFIGGAAGLLCMLLLLPRALREHDEEEARKKAEAEAAEAEAAEADEPEPEPSPKPNRRPRTTVAPAPATFAAHDVTDELSLEELYAWAAGNSDDR
jgi:signal peptidase I